MMTECMEVPAAIREWLERVTDNLEQYICHGVAVPKPPQINERPTAPKQGTKRRLC